MSSILSKLFGSADRLKIVRLFLLNPEAVFTPKNIARRIKTDPESAKKEINLLSGIGFITKKKKTVVDEKEDRKKRIEGWALNSFFPLMAPLRNLVLDTTPLSRAHFLKKLSKIGKIQLVVLSGIFIQEPDSRVDLLVVGDKIQKGKLDGILKEIEAEIGKELVYAAFSTEDFYYRLNIYDKFIRDILDYPHQKILNRLKVSM